MEEKQKDFIQDILPLVRENASNEWKESNRPMLDLGENSKNWGKCCLCNTPNRFIHYITNRHTKEIINVGSDCVKEYAFNDRDINKSRKEAIEIRRLTLLNESAPGINKLVENWKNDLDKYPILIPKSVAREYLQLGEKLVDLYTEYLNGKVKEFIVEEIIELVHKGSFEKEKFDLYINQHENHPFKITRNIVNWLKKENNMEALQALEWLNEDGVISYRTAHRIKESKFMSLIMALMQDKINALQGTILEFDSFHGTYQIQLSPLDNVIINSPHTEILQNFGWLLFDEEEFTRFNILNLLKVSRVEKSEKSFEGILRGINTRLRNEIVIIAEYDFEFNEVYFYHTEKNMYIKDNLTTFINRNFPLAYGGKEKYIRELSDKISLKPRFSSSEFHAIKNGRNNQGIGNLITI